MKYIKTYEDSNVYEYKKYIVWLTLSKLKYEILEVNDDDGWVYDNLEDKEIKRKERIGNEKRSVPVRRIYDYYTDDKEFIKVDRDEAFIPSISHECIVFQSDNIKDCKSFIELDAVTKKYNL